MKSQPIPSDRQSGPPIVEAMQDRIDALEKQIKELRAYMVEQKRLADKSSHEWEKVERGTIQSAYRSGQWYAYQDIYERLP